MGWPTTRAHLNADLFRKDYIAIDSSLSAANDHGSPRGIGLFIAELSFQLTIILLSGLKRAQRNSGDGTRM